MAGALAWSIVPAPTPVNAAGETIVSTFYVPLFEDNARAALFSVNSGTGTALSSTTSVTVGAEGAIMYYDHWEDGYEPAANAKTQASTQVFGDGITTNGDAAAYCVPARCAGDLLPVGAVLRLNNSATVVPGSLATPRVAATVVFDGRDKISATDGLAVTHATWPTAIDALHSEMAAAFDTSRWGVNFSAPVGINTPAQGAGVASFSYTGVEVMAREGGTQVFIDTNRNGVFTDPGDVNGTTIGEGQTVFVNGNVREGARIVTNKPVQVFLMTGVIGSNYENRSFQVFPTEGLVNDYVAPASTSRTSGSPLYATALYLYNPQAAAINVTVATPSGSTLYSIPAGQTLNPAPSLAAGEAARVTSASTFAAVAGVGTREVAGNSLNYDWGYSLLPARLIVDSLFVGWAPGSQDLSVGTYDIVWATVLQPTTLYVDYDADPATGANVDPNGGRYDVALTAAALTQLRISDPNDRDMTGARIYTVDGVGVAAAYGEDPDPATPVGFPGVDLGTTLFPTCGALCVKKSATIADDVDGDGLIDPGDTVRWTITAANTDYYALVNPVLFDVLPASLLYVAGSSAVAVNVLPAVAVADDVVPPAGSLFPYDASGRQIVATIPIGGKATVTYNTVVDPLFAGTAPVCNRGLVISQREIILTPANGADTGCIPIDGLRVTKTSNSGGNPLLPGQALAYTIKVTNASTSTVTGIAVTDPLPAGLAWVSTSVTRPAVGTTTFADDFEVAGDWTGSTGSAAWSVTAWTETDSQTLGTTAGRIRKVADLGDLSTRFGNSSAVNDGISRVVGNLSAFTAVTLAFEKRCNGLEGDDSVALEIRPTGGATPWAALGSFLNCNDAAYVAQSFPLTSGQWGAATEVRFRVVDAFGGGGTDNLFIDNLQFSASARVTSTVPGAAPTNLVTLTDLLAGESATIVVNTTVNNPYTASDEINNVVTVRSGNQVARASVVDCVKCFDYGDDPASFNGIGGLNPARARATSLRSTIADTFQSTGYSGSTGTAPWAAGLWTEVDTGGAGPTAGLVQNVTDASTRSIRIGSATGATAINTAFSRVVGDLSTVTAVNLRYDFRCGNLGADDVAQLQIRPTAAAAWTSLQTFTNCNNATIYSGQETTLVPANYGTATEIRLIVTNAFEANEFFFFDDVQFRTVTDSRTVGPRLGTLLDREVQGTSGASPFPAVPPAAPTGDDLLVSDDEDGVSVPAVDINTIQVPITVVAGTGGISYLNGWFDWSNDGTFQAAESIFSVGSFVSATGALTVVGEVGQAPAPGTYTVTVNVPDLDTNGSGFAIGGIVYSRFRIATQRSGVTSATGPSLDGEVEDYSSTLNTLPVSLSYITSQRSAGNVTVGWRTAQEVDNLGFNLYSQADGGKLTLLTPDLVLSKAPTTVEPQSYSFTAATRTRQLWLEDVSLDGVTEMHGPYVVGESYGDPNPPQAIDWAPARAALERAEATRRSEAQSRARAQSQLRVAAPSAAAVGPVASLAVTERGVQQVTYEQLLAAGVDLAGVSSALLAVTDRRGPVQIEVVGSRTFGPGSALRFIGEPLDTLYTATNVYWVHIDRRLARRILVPPPVVATTTTTTTTSPTTTTTAPVTTTTASSTATSSPSESAATTTAPTTTTTTATTSATTTSTTTTSTTTTSTTAAPTEAPVPTTTVPTTTTAPTTTAPVATTTSTVAPTTTIVAVTAYTETLIEESNVEYSVTAPGADPWFERLLVTLVGSPAQATTTIVVDDPIAARPAVVSVDLWGVTRDAVVDEHHVRLSINGVQVADARFNDNDAKRLEGVVPAGVLVAGNNTLEVTLVDDTGVYVDIVAVDSWKIDYQRATRARSGRLDLTAAGARIDVTGMPAGASVAYRVADNGVVTKLVTKRVSGRLQLPGTATAQRYVVSAVAAVRSPAVSPMLPAADLIGGSADYLIVTNGVFNSALAPLVAYHQSQGRTVKVVDVADVYRAYGHGVVDAAAIDAYLARAIPALGTKWLLLVGADSFDYRDFDGDGSFSLLPSQYGATGFNVTYAPIDPAYADIDGDGTPDVALGRMPARTPAELTTMIDKTLAYAALETAPAVLLVSDTNDGIDYAAANDAVAANFAGWAVRRSDIDRQGVDAARDEVLSAIDDGVALTFYLGHSGSQEWTEVGLFDATIAGSLSNAVPTVVVQFGCWNTYYVAPSADTLAHALLLNPSGGAAVVMGATTLTSSANDIQLANYLAGRIAAGPSTIGEVVLAAKRDLARNAGGSVADVELGWTILGDPATPTRGNG